jgi:hypothetical protein
MTEQINLIHCFRLTKDEFDRLCKDEEIFKTFLKNKVQIEEGLYSIFRGSLDANDEVYEICSSAWKANIRKLNHNVTKVLNFAKSNSKNFYYFDLENLSIYFKDKSDMELMFLNFKILA